MNIALLIAGGSGNRMGQDIPKRMFFQTGAKIVKFRFIVNKKRKL